MQIWIEYLSLSLSLSVTEKAMNSELFTYRRRQYTVKKAPRSLARTGSQHFYFCVFTKIHIHFREILALLYRQTASERHRAKINKHTKSAACLSS